MNPSFFCLISIFVIIAVCCSEVGGQTSEQDISRSNYSSLVRMPSVQNDLELTDEQLSVIEQQSELMSDTTGKYGQELLAHARNGGSPEARMNTRKRFLADITVIADRIDAELLPHQRKRLKQIIFQHSLRKSQSPSPYLTPRLDAELKLSEEQKTEIRDSVDKMDSEIEKETKRFLAKLQDISDENQKRVLSVLTEEQNEKAEKLIGRPVDFQPFRQLYQQINQALKRK